MRKSNVNQDIIDRIAKLLALANSPNENEASQAAAKAQELLMQHNLSLSDIKTGETGEASSDTRIEKTEIDSSGKKVYWKGQIANALARSNFCQMWWSGNHTVIVGKTHNVAIVKSLYDYLVATVERLATEGVKSEKRNYQNYLKQIQGTGIDAFTEPNWRTWKSSFINGCGGRICDRIFEQKLKMETEGIPSNPCAAQGFSNNVTGLACRQAYEREFAAIERWKREHGIAISRRAAGSKARITRDGYTAGQRAGDSISLNRQMNAGASSRLLK